MQLQPEHATRAVELFCGIGGFRIAADRLGIETVWANDISASACAVYRDSFGTDVLHEGDIHDLLMSIPDHEILTAGFPCQPFSAAGKKEGTRDPRGTLFQTIVDVVKRKSPKHFVLENVKRLLSMEQGAHFATVLSALSALEYLIEWRVLNAKDFGLAQNRERVVIVGTRLDAIVLPEKNVRNVLRLANSDDLAFAPKGAIGLLARTDAWKPLGRHGAKFPFWGVAMNGRFFACDLGCFSAASNPVRLRDVLERDPPKEYDLTQMTLGRLQHNEAVGRYVHGVEIVSNQAGGARMGYTIFGIGGIAPTLTASTSRHYERYQIGEQYRRLTPREYARLQGFPDDHCRSASRSDQYQLYGNAVPPPMVEWVLGQVMEERLAPCEPKEAHQRELFYA